MINAYPSWVTQLFFDLRHVVTQDETFEYDIVVERKYHDYRWVKMGVKLSSSNQINSLGFRISGNPFWMAGMEWLARFLEGKYLAECQLSLELIQRTLPMPLSQQAFQVLLFELYREITNQMQELVIHE